MVSKQPAPISADELMPISSCPRQAVTFRRHNVYRAELIRGSRCEDLSLVKEREIARDSTRWLLQP